MRMRFRVGGVVLHRISIASLVLSRISRKLQGVPKWARESSLGKHREGVLCHQRLASWNCSGPGSSEDRKYQRCTRAYYLCSFGTSTA
jgi:hypothetical protein